MGTTKLPHEKEDELDTIIKDSIEEIEETEEKGCVLTMRMIYEKLAKIDEHALSNNKDILDLKKQSYKYDIAVLNETHFIKKAIGTHNRIAYGVMFGVGTIFGMMYQTWLPYANILWELVKFTK